MTHVFNLGVKKLKVITTLYNSGFDSGSEWVKSQNHIV